MGVLKTLYPVCHLQTAMCSYPIGCVNQIAYCYKSEDNHWKVGFGEYTIVKNANKQYKQMSIGTCVSKVTAC